MHASAHVSAGSFELAKAPVMQWDMTWQRKLNLVPFHIFWYSGHIHSWIIPFGGTWWIKRLKCHAWKSTMWLMTDKPSQEPQLWVLLNVTRVVCDIDEHGYWGCIHSLQKIPMAILHSKQEGSNGWLMGPQPTRRAQKSTGFIVASKLTIWSNGHRWDMLTTLPLKRN